jgi:hypothetical protein
MFGSFRDGKGFMRGNCLRGAAGDPLFPDVQDGAIIASL